MGNSGSTRVWATCMPKNGSPRCASYFVITSLLKHTMPPLSMIGLNWYMRSKRSGPSHSQRLRAEVAARPVRRPVDDDAELRDPRHVGRVDELAVGEGDLDPPGLAELRPRPLHGVARRAKGAVADEMDVQVEVLLVEQEQAGRQVVLAHAQLAAVAPRRRRTARAPRSCRSRSSHRGRASSRRGGRACRRTSPPTPAGRRCSRAGRQARRSAWSRGRRGSACPVRPAPPRRRRWPRCRWRPRARTPPCR